MVLVDKKICKILQKKKLKGLGHQMDWAVFDVVWYMLA